MQPLTYFIGNMSRISIALVIAALMICEARTHPDKEHRTPIDQCKGLNIEDLQERVEVKPCGKNRCKIRKGTSGTIKLRFKPDREIKELNLDIFGILNDVQLPFVGVTGNSVCNQIINVETGDTAACPLAPGVEYSYNATFPVEEFYPSISVRLHWGLKDSKGDVICFEVPVVIK